MKTTPGAHRCPPGVGSRENHREASVKDASKLARLKMEVLLEVSGLGKNHPQHAQGGRS